MTASFEEYFASELEKSNKQLVEDAGDLADSQFRVKETMRELEQEVDLRTGKPFNIFGLSEYEPNYKNTYSRLMYKRFRNPFMFWDKMMGEPIPAEERTYLESKGYLVKVETEEVETKGESKE